MFLIVLSVYRQLVFMVVSVKSLQHEHQIFDLMAATMLLLNAYIKRSKLVICTTGITGSAQLIYLLLTGYTDREVQ
mgnify:CR=1 FL=1